MYEQLIVAAEVHAHKLNPIEFERCHCSHRHDSDSPKGQHRVMSQQGTKGSKLRAIAGNLRAARSYLKESPLPTETLYGGKVEIDLATVRAGVRGAVVELRSSAHAALRSLASSIQEYEAAL
jgi:hypothetical protein